MIELRGICVALCTPLTEDGEKIDETALKNHIDSMIEAGVHHILVNAGTGEFGYLRPSERKRNAEIASKHIGGRVGFMIQTSAVSTANAIEAAKHAENLGADCLLVLPPYFEKLKDDEIYYHYVQISETIKVPIMLYNNPYSSPNDITPTLFKRLIEIENIKSIKDSSDNLMRVQDYLAFAEGRVSVFNGGDAIAFAALNAGCSGCLLGAVNFMPKEFVRLYDLIVEKNHNETNELWKRMLPAARFICSHSYTASVKAATNLTGRKVGPCRKPLHPLSENEIKELKEALKPLGL
jgi:4-hydroxy-tetrahydrodipicolinate synthase